MLDVGDPAPDFELRDQDGDAVRLSRFAGHKFASDEGLGFTLLSDPDNKVADMFGIEQVKHRTLEANERSTFVIGPDAMIRHVFRKVDPDEHDELVLGALAAAA